MQMRRKLIVFLGPPGSGKGTQGNHLAASLNIPVISTGDLLRRECQAGTDLGRRIEATLQSGRLLPDGEMTRVLANRLSAPDCQQACILDGFPRTVKQAQFLDGWLADAGGADVTVFDFVVSAEELVERLCKRRQCPTCGTIFTTRQDARLTCPKDRSLLITRSDDQPHVIHERLHIYQRNSGPLTRYYRGASYYQVSAEKSPDCITQELLSIVHPVAQPGPARFSAAAGPALASHATH